VEGTIFHRSILMNQVNFQSAKKFHVAVRSGDWFICTTDVETGDKVEIGFEQGTVYRVSTFSKPRTNNLVALIESEEVPDGDGSLIAFLWLAYASSCHLAGVTNSTLAPVWILDDSNLRYEGFKMRASWILGTESPYLPLSVSYFNDGNFRILDHQTGRRTVSLAPAPYDRGYLNATYEANSLTNYRGLLLPTKFLFTRYAVPPEFLRHLPPRAASVGSVITGTSRLVVRSLTSVDDAKPTVSNLALSSFKPKFSETLTYSLAVVNVLNTITNGNWPDVDATLKRNGGNGVRTNFLHD